MGKNLVDWYSSYLISRKDKIQSISGTVVADAFFSKETFITPMCESNFHVISRFRNDVILYYPTLEKKNRKTWSSQVVWRQDWLCQSGSAPMQGIRSEQGKAIRFEGICKSSQKVRFLIRLVSDRREDRQVAALFLYRRFHGWTRSAGLLQNQVPTGILL